MFRLGDTGKPVVPSACAANISVVANVLFGLFVFELSVSPSHSLSLCSKSCDGVVVLELRCVRGVPVLGTGLVAVDVLMLPVRFFAELLPFNDILKEKLFPPAGCSSW